MAENDMYSIGKVARLLGLTPRQIRYYQARGLVSPVLTSGGHRLFGAQEVKTLQEIRDMLSRGWTLGEVKEFLEEGGADERLTISEGIERQGYEDVKIYFGLDEDDLKSGRKRR